MSARTPLRRCHFQQPFPLEEQIMNHTLRSSTALSINVGVALMIAAAANKSALAAITVKNITANTTIFSDDGFEDDTVGNHPNAPTAGTWNTPATTTTG